MFAPPIVKAQPKAATSSSNLLQRHGDIAFGIEQRSLGSEALTPPSGDFGAIAVFALHRPASSGPLRLRRKRVVGHVDDRLEPGTDRAADQVMGLPGPRFPIAAALPLRRECTACEEEDESRMLQRKPIGKSAFDRGEAPDIVHQVLRSPGRPLDPATKAFFESSFGHDFSGVRIHTGATEAESARRVRAKAYTVERDIVFDAGQYDPASPGGAHLLAHELAHVVPNGMESSETRAPLAVSAPGDAAEHEADAAADAVMRGLNLPSLGRPLPSVQRQPTPHSEVPNPPVPACPPTSGEKVNTLNEYIGLIRCAESQTGYSPRDMLAMLRQLYYGTSWSSAKGGQDPTWDAVIPCSPNLGNPEGKLGKNLFEALRNSHVVEGVHVGHVFAGLEAMTCPSPSVTISRSKYGVGIELTIDLSNEAFASWGGDIGAAAGAMTACWMMTDPERAKAKECMQGNTPRGLVDYFLFHAPPEELEGDIAPFAMRAAEIGIPCSSSAATKFNPQSPISGVFANFYSNQGALGKTSTYRYQCFSEVIGAKTVDGKITNRAELLKKYEPGVLKFAWAYYIKLKKEIPRSDPVVPLLEKNVRGALNLFFDWLSARAKP
jgi:hypothetical protein